LNKKNILLISYFFPPFAGGGVVRIKSIFNFLSEKKYNVFVLTATNDSYPAFYELEPENLELKKITRVKLPLNRRIVGSLNKHIASSKKTSSGAGIKKKIKSFFAPDEYAFWAFKSARTGIKLCKREKIDVLFCTGPPFSAFLSGYLISKFYKCDLILDYRDLWTQNPFLKKSFFANKLNRFLERRILKKAKYVIATNPKAEAQLKEFEPEITKKINVIHNGYVYKPASSELAYPFLNNSGFINFVYSGSLTKNRTPEYFFKALQSFKECNFKISFLGFFDVEHYSLIDKYGLKEKVNVLGSKTFQESYEYQLKKADVFLVFQRNSDGGKTAIPGKLYEYLALQKPVLCYDDDEGATTDFLNTLGLKTIRYNDVNASKIILNKIFLDYSGFLKSQQLETDVLEQFDRKNQNEKLINLLS
jgi:glycosyltransferase involved in cell wall biosynthesis